MIKKDYRTGMILLLQESGKSSNQENHVKSWFRQLLKIKINE